MSLRCALLLLNGGESLSSTKRHRAHGPVPERPPQRGGAGSPQSWRAAVLRASAAPDRPPGRRPLAASSAGDRPHPTSTAPASQTASARSPSPWLLACEISEITSASAAIAVTSPSSARPGQAERVELVAGQQREVGLGRRRRRARAHGATGSPRGRPRRSGRGRQSPATRGPDAASGPAGRSPGPGPRRHRRAARPAIAHRGGEARQHVTHASSAKAAAAASTVRSTCSGVWASEGNQASNWDGGG